MSDPEVDASQLSAGEAAPSSAWLALILLLTLGTPLVLRACGTGVGSFSMFTRPILYHLRIVVTEDGRAPRPIALRELEPHLGRDARRIVLPGQDWFVGETHAELVAGGLKDLAELVCRVYPFGYVEAPHSFGYVEAPHPPRAVDVLLDRNDLEHHAMLGQVEHVDCP